MDLMCLHLLFLVHILVLMLVGSVNKQLAVDKLTIQDLCLGLVLLILVATGCKCLIGTIILILWLYLLRLLLMAITELLWVAHVYLSQLLGLLLLGL